MRPATACLSGDASSIRLARALVGRSIGVVPDEVRDSAVLLTSEVVTNAVLIMHGTNDPHVPYAQSEELAEAMRKAGRTSASARRYNNPIGTGRSMSMGMPSVTAAMQTAR